MPPLIEILLALGLFMTMLGMGLTLAPRDFKRLLVHPRAALLGILCQLVGLPLVGWAVIHLLDTPPLLAVGLMCVTLCPGGITSNMFSLLARGDVALSIALTSAVSLITPITLPIALHLVLIDQLGESRAVHLPVGETIALLVALTVIPVALGMALKQRFARLARAAVRALEPMAVVLVVGLTILAIQQSWGRIGGLVASIGPAVLLLNVSCVAGSLLAARLLRLPRRQALTIGIEVGIQNDTVALLITGTVLQSATMFLAPAAYAVVSMANGCLLIALLHAPAWRIWRSFRLGARPAVLQ